MNEIKANPGRIVVLGRRKENQARCVTFNIAEWRDLYGEGTVQLLAQRNQDEAPYPCAVTEENGIVRWVIREADVAVPGEGKAELQYHVGETVAVSDTYRTWVLPSLGAPGAEPPAPEQDWVETVLQAARDAAQSAQDAKDAVTQTISIGENGNWFIDGEDTGVSASGPQGEQGKQGEPGESGLPRVLTVPGTEPYLATLLNNYDYRCIEPVTHLTVPGFRLASDGRSECWSIHFVAGDSITVTLPDTVVWNYNATPVFTPGSEYWLMFTPMLNGKVLGVWNEVEA